MRRGSRCRSLPNLATTVCAASPTIAPICSAVSRSCPPFGQQILDAVDLAICEDVTSLGQPSGVRQLGDGRLRRPGTGHRLGGAGSTGAAAGGRRGAGRAGRSAPALAGHRDEDHDRRAAAGRRGHHRPVRGDRPRHRRGADLRRPASRGSTSGAPGRTSRPARRPARRRPARARGASDCWPASVATRCSSGRDRGWS